MARDKMGRNIEPVEPVSSDLIRPPLCSHASTTPVAIRMPPRRLVRNASSSPARIRA